MEKILDEENKNVMADITQKKGIIKQIQWEEENGVPFKSKGEHYFVYLF